MLRFIFVIFAILGSVFLSIGLFILRDTLQQTDGTILASGIIVDQQGSVDSSGEPTYRPIIRFTPTNGDDVTFVGQVESRDLPIIGATVPIRYNPSRPRQALIDSFTTLWLLPIVFSSVGGLMLTIPLLGGLFWLLRRKRKRKR